MDVPVKSRCRNLSGVERIHGEVVDGIVLVKRRGRQRGKLLRRQVIGGELLIAQQQRLPVGMEGDRGDGAAPLYERKEVCVVI